MSQGSRRSILRWLDEVSLSGYFSVVVGKDEVPVDRQKPFPDGLLLCLDRIGATAPGTALYIGDHETDAATAASAKMALNRSGHSLRIVSVGAMFCGPLDNHGWRHQPDHWVDAPHQVICLVRVIERGTL